MSYAQKQHAKKSITTDGNLQKKERISQYPVQKEVKVVQKATTVQSKKSALVPLPNARIKPNQKKKIEQVPDSKPKNVVAKKTTPQAKKETKKKVLPVLSNNE